MLASSRSASPRRPRPTPDRARRAAAVRALAKSDRPARRSLALWLLAALGLVGLAGCRDEGEWAVGGATGTGDPALADPAAGTGGRGLDGSAAAGPAAADDAEAAAFVRALAAPDALPPDLGAWLLDVAVERGLDYVNVSGEAAKATILEANGAGVALFDLDADGDLDLAFAQGLGSLEQLVAGPGADIAIYRNLGNGRFERAPGPGLSGWWTGLAAGDVDGDGDTDLVCGGFGSLRIVLQEEGGRLVPGAELIADPARRLVPGEPRSPGKPPDWITSVALFDADRDGHLDLYAGLYLDLDPVDPTIGQVGEGVLALPCRWKGLDVYCGPHGLPPQGDRIYRGRGDGTFVDRTAAWLPDHVPGYTLAVGAADSDGDGDTDLYVANDSTANLMLVNELSRSGGKNGEPRGAFVDYGLVAGVAVSQDGAAEAGMGVAWGDVDRDGRLDLAVTNFSDEPTALYFGADAGFTNQTYRWGLNRASSALLSWGCHLVDLDGDGWLELFTANGHVYPQADAEHTGTRYGQPDTLWSFGADHRVLAWPAGDARSVLAPALPTRGSAVGDLDGDGRPDLVLTRLDGPCALALNRTDRARGAERHWLEVRLSAPPVAGDEDRGLRTPRDAMGTRVVLVPTVPAGAPEYALAREVQTSGSYQSSSSPYLSFGLGPASEVATLVVLWPSGRRDEFGPLRADQRLWIEEGRGITRAEDLAAENEARDEDEGSSR